MVEDKDQNGMELTDSDSIRDRVKSRTNAAMLRASRTGNRTAQRVESRISAATPDVTPRWLNRRIAIMSLGLAISVPVGSAAAASGFSHPLMIETFGESLCGTDAADGLTDLVGIIASLFFLATGMFEVFQGFEDRTSGEADKRQKGYKELVGGVIRIIVALVVVPFAGIFIIEILPGSLSCVGFDLTDYLL
jgi:hypothetical protein